MPAETAQMMGARETGSLGPLFPESRPPWTHSPENPHVPQTETWGTRSAFTVLPNLGHPPQTFSATDWVLITSNSRRPAAQLFRIGIYFRRSSELQPSPLRRCLIAGQVEQLGSSGMFYR
jgi:hypothetical protein